MNASESPWVVLPHHTFLAVIKLPSYFFSVTYLLFGLFRRDLHSGPAGRIPTGAGGCLQQLPLPHDRQQPEERGKSKRNTAHAHLQEGGGGAEVVGANFFTKTHFPL